MVTTEQKLLAVLAHLAYFLGGLGFIIAPLVIFLFKKDDYFVQYHAKQALVAHLLILIASSVVSILCFLLVGIILVPILAVLWLTLLVTSIIASVRAVNGEYYEYPLIQKYVNML